MSLITSCPLSLHQQYSGYCIASRVTQKFPFQTRKLAKIKRILKDRIHIPLKPIAQTINQQRTLQISKGLHSLFTTIFFIKLQTTTSSSVTICIPLTIFIMDSPPPWESPHLLRQLLHQLEMEISLYVAAAAFVYAFLVFLNVDCARIVEKNPKKFKIDTAELESRRNFIEHTKQEVKSMKERLNLTKKDRDVTARQPVLEDNSPLKMPQVVTHGSTRYSRLVNEADSPNNEFIERTLAQQQMIMGQQDEHLDQIATSMGTLKTMSRHIGSEIDEQAVMLDDFGHEMENTQSKMENTLNKVAKVMHLTNDRRQWAAIGALSGVLAVVIVLFFVL